MNPRSAVVIEEDENLALLISTALEQLQFTVHTAPSGPLGVETTRSTEPALVTTEITLPGFDGLEVIRRIRTFSDAPILIITKTNTINNIEITLLTGADGYLAKPVRPAILQAYTKALLRRPTHLQPPH